tara:strand:+ start:340 stop:504 length:165 start_codon:yes stop_codon:yes gene_type:complete
LDKKKKIFLKKEKLNDKTLLMYDGKRRYTFLNASIWECLRFWIWNKLGGGDVEY